MAFAKAVITAGILIVSLWNSGPSPASADRSSYGEQCNKTVKCDSRAWLGCFEGRCDCLKQDEMLYDPTLEACVSRAGERCKYAIESSASVALQSTDDPAYRNYERRRRSIMNGNSNSNTHTGTGSGHGNNGDAGAGAGSGTGQSLLNNNGHPNGNGKINGNGNGSALIFEVTNCVPNAFCNTDGICVCDSKFHENLNGTCTLSQNHLEPCDSYNLKCSHYQGLHCDLQANLCRCNETISEYSEPLQQCVGLGGHSCINAKCTNFSTCYTKSMANSYNSDDGDTDQGPGNQGNGNGNGSDQKVKPNTCTCTADFFRSDEDHRCKAKIGPLGNCTRDEQCQRKPGLELMCSDGICNCNPNISQFASAQKAERYRYDPDIFNGFLGQFYTQCVGLAGSKCLDRLCVPRAFCSYSFINDFSGTCKCLTGYQASKDGKCGHGYSESCDGPDSCLEGLVCRDKKCTCQYSGQDYDSTRRLCFSKFGGPCNVQGSSSSNGTVTGTGTGSRMSSPVPCGPNAGCVSGHCICQEGYVDNANGDCEIGYRGRCETTSECDTVSALECINNRCQCGQFAEYSERARKCRGLAGARCDARAVDECVELATCHEVHPKLPGVCMCGVKLPSVETADYHCRER